MPPISPSRAKVRQILIGVMIGASALAVVFFGVAWWLIVAAQQSSAGPATVAAVAPVSAVPSATVAPAEASATATATAATATPPPTAPAASVTTPSAPAVASTAPAVAVAPTDAASVDAYRGLGTWVDIYDASAWRDPAAAVANMASHGVRTLFIETANYHSPDPIFDPAQQNQFIEAAHAHGMKIVAWYLPDMKKNSVDYARVMAAIDYRTPSGQKFDSFALDIEATTVSSEALRNAGLQTLSSKVRSAVGASYPLGAITPSPVGLARPHSAWANFPYTMLAGIYNVFVPMGYYTYHGHSASATLADVRGNLRILRSKPGCAAVPVHLIGGIAENSSDAETQAFVNGVLAGKCVGASVYGWAGTSAGAWRALAAVAP